MIQIKLFINEIFTKLKEMFFSDLFYATNLTPLFWINFAYISGLTIYFTQNYFLILMFLSIYIFYILKKPKPIVLLLIAFAFSAAIINTEIQKNNFKNNYILFDKNSTVKAKVLDIQEINSKNNFKYLIKIKTILPVANKIININCIWNNELIFGDIIEITNLTIKIPKKSIQIYNLLAQNNLANIFTIKLDYKLINRPANSIYKTIYNLNNRIEKSLKNKMPESAFSIFNKIFLGDKSYNSKVKELKNKFQNWGISHYLSRSGLHLLILVSIFTILFRLIPLGIDIKYLLTTIIMILYYLLTISSVSFSRAITNLIFSTFFIITQKNYNTNNMLSLICLINLIYNPFQALLIDFQFSFIIAFLISYFYKIKKLNKNYSK